MKILTRKEQKRAVKLIESTYDVVVRSVDFSSYINGNMHDIAENLSRLIDIVEGWDDVKSSLRRKEGGSK